MAPALALCFLLPAALAALASAQCFPLDPDVVNKTIASCLSCDRLFALMDVRFSIKPWGIFFKPLFTQIPLNELVCPEDITVLFRRTNVPAMLLWRPAVKATFFKESHSKLYAKHLVEKKNFQYDYRNDIDPRDYVQFPCAMVQVQRIARWGPQQKLFVRLVQETFAGIKRLQDHDCPRPPVPGEEDKFTREQLDWALSRAAVVNYAFAYLRNLAYSNFFCV